MDMSKSRIVFKNLFRKSTNGYKVLSYEPFASSQNIEGTYPIMVQTFICSVKGDLAISTNETRFLRWVSIEELENLLEDHWNKFYPMHVNTLRKYIKLNTRENAS
jgi:ADP-ribose pyrophosphatase